MLEVENLSAGYGGGDVIRGLTFTAMKGELYLLLGANGAGKTTTFRAITGILPPSRGRVIVEGIDLWREPEKAKVKIGYLPEGERVYPNLSVYRNLLLFARLYGVAEERIEGVLREFNLWGYRDRKAGELSRGLRKRLVLARALIHEPEILVLDEPFSNLDVPSVIDLRDKIFESLDEGEGCPFLDAHTERALQHFEGVRCRVGIITEGKLVLEEKLENLMSLLSGVEVVIVVSNLQRALQVLKERGYDVRAEGRNIVVSVSNYTSEVPEITRALAENGVGILQVRPKEVPVERLFKEISRGFNNFQGKGEKCSG